MATADGHTGDLETELETRAAVYSKDVSSALCVRDAVVEVAGRVSDR